MFMQAFVLNGQRDNYCFPFLFLRFFENFGLCILSRSVENNVHKTEFNDQFKRLNYFVHAMVNISQTSRLVMF